MFIAATYENYWSSSILNIDPDAEIKEGETPSPLSSEYTTKTDNEAIRFVDIDGNRLTLGNVHVTNTGSKDLIIGIDYRNTITIPANETFVFDSVRISRFTVFGKAGQKFKAFGGYDRA